MICLFFFAKISKQGFSTLSNIPFPHPLNATPDFPVPLITTWVPAGSTEKASINGKDFTDAKLAAEYLKSLVDSGIGNITIEINANDPALVTIHEILTVPEKPLQFLLSHTKNPVVLNYVNMASEGAPFPTPSDGVLALAILCITVVAVAMILALTAILLYALYRGYEVADSEITVDIPPGGAKLKINLRKRQAEVHS